ncbi:MAG: sensor domain-containing diguanylate cyclase [Pseudomonadota bacterium]
MQNSVHSQPYVLVITPSLDVESSSAKLPFSLKTCREGMQTGRSFFYFRDVQQATPLTFTEIIKNSHQRISLNVEGQTFPVSIQTVANHAGESRLIVQVKKPISSNTDYTELTHEQRLKAILESTDAGAWEWNYQTGELILNERWAEMVGYTLEELAPVSIDTWFKVLHPDDAKISERAFQRHFDEEDAFYHCELRIVHKNGSTVWIRDHGRVVTYTENNEPEWICGTHIDITGSKLLEKRLRDSESTLSQAQRIARIGHWKANFSTDHLEWSEMIYEMLGLSPQDTVPSISLFKSLVHHEDLKAVEESEQKSLKTGEHDITHRMYRADGEIIWVHEKAKMLNDKVTLVGTVKDVTKQKQLEEKLLKQSRIDYLTNLYNRFYFLELFEHHLAIWKRSKQPVSLLIIDVDNFKLVNDRYGHIAGDKVLQDISSQLSSSTREYDVCARIGGEEFAVLLPDTKLKEAVSIADKLRNKISHHSTAVDNYPIKLSVTIGVSSLADERPDWTSMYSAADAAMYQGKSSGRNTVVSVDE